MKKCIVIGAGIGGLATAALLAKDGYSVTILEKNSVLGGRAMSWEKDGFRFDMGPSWYQVPQAFEHFFSNFDKQSSDFYKLVKLDPQYRVFTDSGKVDISAKLEKTLSQYEKIEPGAAKKIRKFLDFGKLQYDVLSKNILYSDSSFKNWLNPKTFKEMSQLRTWESLENYVSRFTKNKMLAQLLTYTALFIGSSPKKLPALFSMLSYLDIVVGTYYPQGGIVKVVDALTTLCRENKVKIVTNAEVKRILVKDGKVTKVKTSFKDYLADVVISNADYPFTEMKLLEQKYQTYPESHWNKAILSPSAMVIYLGLSKKLKNVAHHNLYFSSKWDNHFNSLFKTKKLPEDPSYYVSCTSVTDKTVAPTGCENVFITVQIPSGINISEKQKENFCTKIISHFESQIKENISQYIVLKRVFTEADFRETYNAYKGAAIGLATTTMQSIFRPSQESKKVKGLYYVGQYTTPGAGMPMCLISAEKVVKLIKLQYGNE